MTALHKLRKKTPNQTKYPVLTIQNYWINLFQKQNTRNKKTNKHKKISNIRTPFVPRNDQKIPLQIY